MQRSAAKGIGFPKCFPNDFFILTAGVFQHLVDDRSGDIAPVFCHGPKVQKPPQGAQPGRIRYFCHKTFLMDISPEELADLQQIAQKVSTGSELQEITITYREKGVEKSATIDHPILLQLMKLALLEVNRKQDG